MSDTASCSDAWVPPPDASCRPNLIGPSVPSGPRGLGGVRTPRGVTQLTALSTRTLGSRFPPATSDSGLGVSTSDLGQPLGTCPRAQCPSILRALPDAWCLHGARYSPLGTWRGRAAGKLCSGPGGAGCARTRRSPRGRGRSGVSHPAPTRPRPPVR